MKITCLLEVKWDELVCVHTREEFVAKLMSAVITVSLCTHLRALQLDPRKLKETHGTALLTRTRGCVRVTKCAHALSFAHFGLYLFWFLKC